MKILCKCPSGKHAIKVAAKFAGRTVRCPECGEPILVPKADEAAKDRGDSKSSSTKRSGKSSGKSPAKSSAKSSGKSDQTPKKKAATPPPPPPPKPSRTKSDRSSRPAPLPRTDRPVQQPTESKKPRPKPLSRDTSRGESDRPTRPEPPKSSPVEPKSTEKRETKSQPVAPPVDAKEKTGKRKKKPAETAHTESKQKSKPKPQPRPTRDVEPTAPPEPSPQKSEPTPKSKSKSKKKSKKKAKSKTSPAPESKSADELPKPRGRRRILQTDDGPKLMPEGTYRPEQRRVKSVRWLAVGLFALILATLAPAVWIEQLDLVSGKNWARAVTIIAVVQFFFVAWMVNMPDWTSVWIVMLVFAVSATIYGAVTAMVVMTPLDRPVPLGLELYRDMAQRWCAAMVLLNSLATYLCGYISVQWKRTVQSSHFARGGSR